MKNIKALKNLKYIFVITGIVLVLLFVIIRTLSLDLTNQLNATFIYRTGVGTWQDTIYKHSLTPSDNIVIVNIDDASLNLFQSKGDLKMLRLPKSIYIDLIEKLESMGAKGIAFDIIFENTDPDEEKFAKTLKKYKNIVIATEYNPNTTCQKDQTGSTLYTTCTNTPRSVYRDVALGMINLGDDSTTINIGSFTRYGWVGENGLLGDKDPYTIWKDKTGIQEGKVETLPLALYHITGGSGANLPYFDENSILNPYFTWPNTAKTTNQLDVSKDYPQTSLYKVVNMSRVEQVANVNTFSGKYIFIGESGTAIHDMIDSPAIGMQITGVDGHAHFLDGLIQNKMLARAPDNIMFTVFILLSLLLSCLYFFVPKYLSQILAISSFVSIIWVSRYLYDAQRVLVDFMPLFLSGFFLPYVTTYVYRYFVVDREKRELQTNFGHYIDPEVVREITERDDPIELGGEKRELSILFSDIAGFTTLSEKLIPQDLFYLMTSYLSNMTDILIGEGGTLDKYIGDAVMGFFGAPLPHADHAIRACRTALLMRERLPMFNTDITAHGMDPIDFRVGIATGDVMVGNIGSHDRFNYTVLGDTVNLASRLEGTGKEYDVHIIISEGTRTQAGDQFFVRELDMIAVKGKTEGVRIYELIGFAGKVTDTESYESYERALGLYRAGKYREAGEIWAAQMEIDPPSRVMVERCMGIIKGEVVVENGIFHMTHK